jgi:hypothetical protein
MGKATAPRVREGALGAAAGEPKTAAAGRLHRVNTGGATLGRSQGGGAELSDQGVTRTGGRSPREGRGGRTGDKELPWSGAREGRVGATNG